jgi:CheY-like chemotaxis protein
MLLPIYQHPSLTVLVNDNAAFLQRLQSALGPAVTGMAFSDPREALEWVLRQHAGAPAEQLLACDGASLQPHGVTLAIERIFRIGFRPERFMLPSVVVVDVRMQKMDCFAFLEALAGLRCKKILLYDAGDERAVLDAFNRGLADRAIRKSDGDALDQLEFAIGALQRAYFNALSEPLRAPLALHGFSFVGDKAVGRLVRGMIEQYGIVEHYLYAQPGGLLLHDAAGRTRLLVIVTEECMQAHFEVARDNDAPASLLEAIEARCIVPYFRNGDGMYAVGMGERWYRYCAPAQVCVGVQRYFWALFDMEAHELPEPGAPFACFQAARIQPSRSV